MKRKFEACGDEAGTMVSVWVDHTNLAQSAEFFNFIFFFFPAS